MSLKRGDPASSPEEIDRWDGGFGWIAHPDEAMQRASHALVADGAVYVVDPVDYEGLDDALAEAGDVAGVVTLLDRHKRDAAAVARRHDVPVYLHRALSSVADDLDAPTESYDGELPGTGYRAIVLIDNRFWTEVALHDPDAETLVVPEAVGTTEYFRVPGERVGVHPMLRLTPPRALRSLRADRLLVGHGTGIMGDASRLIRSALADSRRQAPRLYLKNARMLLPV